MSIFIFFANLLYFSLSKENISCDSILTISSTYKKLSECQSYDVEEDKNCCVGVVSLMGVNSYFCQSFDKSATEKDISEEMDKKVKSYEDQFLGAVVKAKASCTEDVSPFIGKNCTIDDTQNMKEFNNCSNFKKEKDDDFCCLFTGDVLFDNQKNEVQFCYELNKAETSDMKSAAKFIDSFHRMINIKHINCSPEIPPKTIVPTNTNSLYIKNYNLFLFCGFILLLI